MSGGFVTWLLGVPSDELAERQQKFRDGLCFRAIAAGVFVGLFSALAVINPAGGAKYLPAFPILLILAALNVPYWIAGRLRRFPLRDFYWHWLGDLILIGVLLHALGGADAPYGFLAYLMIVITSATFISKRAAFVVATGATIMTAGLVLAEGAGWLSHREVWSHHVQGEVQGVMVAVMAAFYFMFAYLAGTLADQLKSANLKLAKARRQIEDHSRNLEREVAHRTAELRRRNAEIEEFVQIVTHDLKNLSVGAAETARKLLEAEGRRLSARGQRYAEHLIVDTRMMNQMLRHVLSLFRADSEELKEGEVDLDAIVREALRAYEERIEAKGIRVSVAPLGKVRGDADRIRHVVANLLDNAVKFTGDKSPPEIRVFCRRGPEGMEVVVADNGVGIGEEEREKIFRLYHRGSIKGAPGVDPSGDGVGLAISKRLVERWGGRIWADSVVGQGSEFHFTIPAASGIEQGGGDDESVKRA